MSATNNTSRYITAAQAPAVARALKAAGYPATVAGCTEYVINVARLYGGAEHQAHALRIINAALPH